MPPLFVSERKKGGSSLSPATFEKKAERGGDSAGGEGKKGKISGKATLHFCAMLLPGDILGKAVADHDGSC